MSFAEHAKQAEQTAQKELPPLVAQELSRVVESESIIRIRTFREKFSGILDNTTLNILDSHIVCLEAENETKKQRENQEFCDEQSMLMIKQLMNDYKVNNPLFATVSDGNIELTAFLLSKGYDINIKCGRKDIFTLMLERPNSKIFRMLVDHGMEIPYDQIFDCKFSGDPVGYILDFGGLTSHLLSDPVAAETVLFLLENKRLPVYETLFYAAVCEGHIEVVEYLLNCEPFLNNVALNKWVGLVMIKYKGYSKKSELLMLLLKHGLHFLSKEEYLSLTNFGGKPISERTYYINQAFILYTNCILSYDDSAILHLLRHDILAIYPELYSAAVHTNRTVLIEYILSTGYKPNMR